MRPDITKWLKNAVQHTKIATAVLRVRFGLPMCQKIVMNVVCVRSHSSGVAMWWLVAVT